MTYGRLEKSDKKNYNFLVAGPWNHGGWASGTGKSLGDIPFHNDTGIYFREKIEAPGSPTGCMTKGACRERSHAVPRRQRHLDVIRSCRRTERKRRIFTFRRRKTFLRSAENDERRRADSYLSDPAHPVPYRHRPVDATYPEDHPGSWYTWLVQDQRFWTAGPTC